jgi:hypothetical protein
MSCRSWTDQEIEDLACRSADKANAVLGEWLNVDPDDHTVDWIPARWRDWVDITVLPDRLRRDGTIRRRDLFDLADDVATGGGNRAAAALLIGVVAWGSGSGLRQLGIPDGDPRGPWRAQRALSIPNRSAAAARIRQAVDTTRRDGGWGGYAALSYGGPAHLAAMGESFFTKLIYASGHRATATPRPLPLILDTNVRKALVRSGGILEGEEWWLNYTPQAYRQYLLIAQTWAGLWGIRSDAVEYALFQFGRAVV